MAENKNADMLNTDLFGLPRNPSRKTQDKGKILSKKDLKKVVRRLEARKKKVKPAPDNRKWPES